MSAYTSKQYRCDICEMPFDALAEGIVLSTGGFDLDGIMDIFPSCASRLTKKKKNEIESIRSDVYSERVDSNG